MIMSLLAIQAALEKHLLTLAPAIATAVENKTFTPVTGQPYQRVHHLINKPVDLGLSLDAVESRGLLQVNLMFPLNGGRVPAMQRAEAIAAHFKPPRRLHENGINVELVESASIAGGVPDGDRWFVPVTVAWRAFIAT